MGQCQFELHNIKVLDLKDIVSKHEVNPLIKTKLEPVTWKKTWRIPLIWRWQSMSIKGQGHF
jgi:hypothetical protein